jgi:predicted Zn finger-like uncharacterized protein
MTVECPSCATSFPVDPKKVPAGGVHARCSVCEEVFFVEEPSMEAEPTLVEAPQEAPFEEAVEESFTAPVEVEEEAEAPGEDFEGSEPDEAFFTAPVEIVEDSPAEPVDEAAKDGPTFGQADPALAEETFGEPEPEVEVPEAPAPEEEDEPATSFEAPAPEEEDEPATSFEAPAPEEEDEPVTSFEAPAPEEEDEPATSFEAPAPEEEDEPVTSFEAPAPEEEAEPTLPDPVTTSQDLGSTFGDPEPTFDIGTTSFDAPIDAPTGVAPEEAAPETEFPFIQEEPRTPTFEAPAPPPVEDTAAATFDAPAPTLPTPQFGKRDPKEKAQRLARVLVSDIILYNPDRHQRALDEGRIKEEFDDEVQKSWDEYVDQVGDEIANSTDFFSEALNEILAKGQQMF